MTRGKPSKYKFMNGERIKFSANISKETKLNIEIVAGQLVEEFGYAPSQGEVLHYVFQKYLKDQK